MAGLLFIASQKQIGENQKEMADLKDRVRAVQNFQKEHSRLPSKAEIPTVLGALPTRYFPYDYSFATSREQAEVCQTNWPANGGWVLSYWQGEWFEYYSSWNNYYSLEEGSTWWGFCGWLLFFPIFPISTFLLSRLPALRSKSAPMNG